ncbi:hypothetical protein IWQ61_008158 [Dispira simplex]|nr:hypothetical protein IWQ61_008158 [Dispira simplex]
MTATTTPGFFTTRNSLLLLYAVLRHGSTDWEKVAHATAESLLRIIPLAYRKSETLETAIRNRLSAQACQNQYELLLDQLKSVDKSDGSVGSDPEKWVVTKLRKQYIDELELQAQENREEFKRLVSDLTAIQRGQWPARQVKRKIEHIVERRKRRKMDQSFRFNSVEPSPKTALDTGLTTGEDRGVSPTVEPLKLKDIASSPSPSLPPTISAPPSASEHGEEKQGLPFIKTEPDTDISEPVGEPMDIDALPFPTGLAPKVSAEELPGSESKVSSDIVDQIKAEPIPEPVESTVIEEKVEVIPTEETSAMAYHDQPVTSPSSPATFNETVPSEAPSDQHPVEVAEASVQVAESESKAAAPEPEPTEVLNDLKEEIPDETESEILAESGPNEEPMIKPEEVDEMVEATSEAEEEKEEVETEVEEGEEEGEEVLDPQEQEKKHKNWKKLISMIWREIANHRAAGLFTQPIKAQDAPGYYDIIKKPIDLKTIRLRIRDDKLTTTDEFHRDILHMLINALMYNSEDSEVYQMTLEMLDAAENDIETFKNSEAFSNRPAGAGGTAASFN